MYAQPDTFDMFLVLSLTLLLRNSILCSAVTNRVNHARLFCAYRELFLRHSLVTQPYKLFLYRHLFLRPQFVPLTEQSVVFRLLPVSSASARNSHSSQLFFQTFICFFRLFSYLTQTNKLFLDCHIFLRHQLVPHTEQSYFQIVTCYFGLSSYLLQNSQLFLARHLFLRPQFVPLTENSVDFRLAPISSASARASYRTASCFQIVTCFFGLRSYLTQNGHVVWLPPIFSVSSRTSHRTGSCFQIAAYFFGLSFYLTQNITAATC